MYYSFCKHFGLFMKKITIWYQFSMLFLGQMTFSVHLCMHAGTFEYVYTLFVYMIYICSCGYVHICGVYV